MDAAIEHRERRCSRAADRRTACSTWSRVRARELRDECAQPTAAGL